jgi:hypothetical protein
MDKELLFKKDYFLATYVADEDRRKCEQCETYQIFSLSNIENVHCAVYCTALKLYVNNKKSHWSSQASTLGRYVRALHNIDDKQESENIYGSESVATLIEQSTGLCLFCDGPVTAETDWRCTCGIRDVSFTPPPEPLPTCFSPNMYRIPAPYGIDNVSIESLLVLEALYGNTGWIDFDGKFLLAKIKRKRTSAVILILSEANEKTFDAPKVAPKFERDVTCPHPKGHVFLTYANDQTEPFTAWRPLWTFLKCRHRELLYVRNVRRKLPAHRIRKINSTETLKDICTAYLIRSLLRKKVDSASWGKHVDQLPCTLKYFLLELCEDVSKHNLFKAYLRTLLSDDDRADDIAVHREEAIKVFKPSQ